MCDDSLVLSKTENVEVAKDLPNDENVIASEKKRCDVRLLNSHLANLLIVLELVYHDQATVAGEDHALGPCLKCHFVYR